MPCAPASRGRWPLVFIFAWSSASPPIFARCWMAMSPATPASQMCIRHSTKDAAAEIRERVRGALIEEGMGDIALQVDDAWISTIHGMCSRILRAHALELISI